LAAAVAATVFADQQRWSRTVEHRRDQVQAQALAMAGVQWARQILDNDARRSEIDHLGEAWAVALPPIPLENGEIRGAIVDAQGRLNINALGDGSASSEQERRRIAKLFAQRGGPVAALDALADWIDVDGRVRDAGAEDTYYGAQSVPGLTANVPVLRIAELSSVKGVSAQALDAVAPFLSALPAGTALNVNTASAEVLAAVVDGLSGEGLAGFVGGRAQKPFATIAEFRSRLPRGATLGSEAALAVKSSYFYVTVEARQGTTLARARALLARTGNTWPGIVWQVVE
ncbi:MAG: type II secretion system minor pseudopilin GspK, partial [Betaproteobacteria bacterium]